MALLHRQREIARLERAKSYADAFIYKLEAITAEERWLFGVRHNL